jgi:hypothetical protein
MAEGYDMDNIIKVNSDYLLETSDGNFKMVYHDGPVSCSVVGGHNVEYKDKLGESKTIHLPHGWTFEKIDNQ